MDESPDLELVAGLRASNPRSLERLVEAYREPLARYADSILDGLGSEDDVVQEVLIRLWIRREALATEGSLRSLLYTMTRNQAVDERRRSQRAAEREKAWEPSTSRGSPFENAVERELEERAQIAVAALPARRQEVFRLVREGGLSYQEVSTVMGISPQTVANHMSLALAALRGALASTLGQPLDSVSPQRKERVGLSEFPPIASEASDPGVVEEGARLRVITGQVAYR